MASRVGGAVTALTAAGLLAASLAMPAWWAGHPTINGNERHLQDVYVGLYGAELCNTGGDGACKAMPLASSFELTAYGELAVGGLLVLVLLAIAALVWTRSDARRTFAKLAIPLAIVGAGGAAALVFQGPSEQAAIPLGYALYLFGGGTLLALIGSVMALGDLPRPRVRLAPARQSFPPAAPIAPTPNVDMQALLQEDTLRPSALGPEPKLGRNAPVQSPGGMLPGPSGPLGAIGNGTGGQPLFASAPQLRPLYDASPEAGGTGGFVPAQPAAFPLRPPTPIPRHEISARAGIPTPASVESPRPVTVAGIPPAPPSAPVGTPLPPRAIPTKGASKQPTMPSPMRAPAPLPSTTLAGAPPPGAPRPSPAPPARKQPTLGAAAVPPPAAPAAPDAPLPKRPVPPPARGAKPTAPPKLAAATLGELKPSTPKLPIKLPVPPRSDTEHETGDFDAQATYQRDPEPRPAAPAQRLFSEGEQLDTDVQHAIAPTVPARVPALDVDDDGEATSFEPPPRAPSVTDPSLIPGAPADARPPTATDAALAAAPGPATGTLQTQAAPPTDDDEQIQTTAREKVSTTDMDLAIVKPPAAAPKVPLSTAPESLPPPSEKQAATSGPSPACPQCEAPMAWVEAHLRFYCKSCKMYF